LRRFVAQPDSVAGTRWTAPKTLLQKWPAPAFSATTVLDFSRAAPGESAGLVVFRQDYAWIGLKKGETGTRLVVAMAKDARNGTAEREVASHNGHGPRVCLRATVSAGGRWRFSASADNRQFTTVGEAFTAKPGL
jgi:beta-xylosidase